MMDVSSARSIDASDQVIDPVFAIDAMIKRRIGERAGEHVEAIAELKHRARGRL